MASPLPDESAAQEFQRRKNQAWLAIRFWLVVMAGGMIALFAIGEPASDAGRQAWMLVFIVIAVAVVRVSFVVGLRYRCPACEKIPMSGGPWLSLTSLRHDYDVVIDPRECPNCGARLK